MHRISPLPTAVFAATYLAACATSNLSAPVARVSPIEASEVVAPPCETPSRLVGQFDATTTVVTAKLKPDTQNAEAVAMALGKKYGIKVRWGYYDGWAFLPQYGFSNSPWTPDKIAQLRCESGVDAVVPEKLEPEIIE